MISICDINSDILGRTNECKICDLTSIEVELNSIEVELNSIEVELNSIEVDLNSIEAQAKLKFELLLNSYWTWELMSQTMEWGPSEITHVIDVTSQLMNAPQGNYIVAKSNKIKNNKRTMQWLFELSSKKW